MHPYPYAMKKILSLLLALIICSPLRAKENGFLPASSEKIGLEAGSGASALSSQISFKARSRMCWIPATVLMGGGALVSVISVTMITGAQERNPQRFAEIQRDQRTGLIIGGSMMVAAVPLFIMAGHYQKKARKGLVFQLKMEPVDGYKGYAMQIPAVGLSLGL